MEPKIIIPIIGFVIALFAIIANNRLAEIRNSRNSIRPAILKYKSSFKDQIANTNGVGQHYLGDMAAGFSKHESAVQDIMPILSKSDKRRLKKAWDEYTGKDNEWGHSPEYYVQTMWGMIEYSTTPEYSEDIQGKLENLIHCLDNLLR